MCPKSQWEIGRKRREFDSFGLRARCRCGCKWSGGQARSGFEWRLTIEQNQPRTLLRMRKTNRQLTMTLLFLLKGVADDESAVNCELA